MIRCVMWTRALLGVLLGLAATIAANPCVHSETYALLLCGNSSDHGERLGFEADIERMVGALMDGWHVNAPVVVRQTDYSLDDYFSAIDSLFQHVDDQDVVILYYTGHGTSGLLQPRLAGMGILSYTHWAHRLASKPGKLVIILDTCDAGSAIPAFQSKRPNRTWLLASVHEGEITCSKDGAGGGSLFTKRLAEAILSEDKSIAGEDGATSLREAYDYACGWDLDEWFARLWCGARYGAASSVFWSETSEDIEFLERVGEPDRDNDAASPEPLQLLFYWDPVPTAGDAESDLDGMKRIVATWEDLSGLSEEEVLRKVYVEHLHDYFEMREASDSEDVGSGAKCNCQSTRDYWGGTVSRPSDGSTIPLTYVIQCEGVIPNRDYVWVFKYFDEHGNLLRDILSVHVRPDGSLEFGTSFEEKGIPAAADVQEQAPDRTTTESGRPVWRFQTDYWIESSPAIGADGTVYFGSDDGCLYALNQYGTMKWRFETGDFVTSSPAIGRDGTVYFGSDDYYVYALNPDGTIKWRYWTTDWVRSSPAIGVDGTVYVGSYDGYLYALEGNGFLRWRFKTGDSVVSSPAIGSDGTIYFGSDDGYLYAVNRNGALKWRYQVEEWGVRSSPAIGQEGMVYFGSDDGYLYVLNRSGALEWRYRTGLPIRSSPAIGADGTIYFGSDDGYLYALDRNGTLDWRYEIEDAWDWWVRSSPALGKDGAIYFSSFDCYVYALNPDGSLRWRYKTERPLFFAGPSLNSSPAVGADGVMYVGSEDGSLYAFRTDSVGASASLWPMFRQNIRHTGCVQ